MFGTPDTTDGYMSRWVVIPFPNSFLGQEDRTLDERLGHPDQLAGLLVRAIAGLRALLARGNFTEPASLAQAFARFADESDPVRGFMRDVTRPDPDGWVQRDTLWTIYQVWADDNGHRKPLSRTQLYIRVEAAGWAPRKRQGARGFVGRTLTVHLVELGLNEKHLEPLEDEQEGPEGAAGAETTTPGPAHGGKGAQTAPSAPTCPPEGAQTPYEFPLSDEPEPPSPAAERGADTSVAPAAGPDTPDHAGGVKTDPAPAARPAPEPPPEPGSVCMGCGYPLSSGQHALDCPAVTR